MGAAADVGVDERIETIAALTIETIPIEGRPTDDPAGGDPTENELLSIGLAIQHAETHPSSGPDETTVLVRDDPSPEAEHRLVSSVVTWLTNHSPDRLVTFGGTSVVGPILRGRADRAATVAGLESDTAALLQPWFEDRHLDLQPAASQQYGSATSFTDLCLHEGVALEPVEWANYELPAAVTEEVATRSSEGRVTSADVPWLGAAYLTSRTLGQESELTTLLVDYTERPLSALLELAANHPFTG